MIQSRDRPLRTSASDTRDRDVAMPVTPPEPGACDPSSWSVPSSAHVARIREALNSLIDLADLSRREVERRLAAKGCGFDLNQFFSGKFHAKLYQILDVCRVLDLHPVELFRLVFKPPERRSPVLERLERIFGSSHPQPVARHPAAAPGGSAMDELCHRVEQLQRDVAELKRTKPAAQPAPPPPRSGDVAALVQCGRALSEQLDEFVLAVARMGTAEAVPRPAPSPGRPSSHNGPNRLPSAAGGKPRIKQDGDRR